MSARVNKSSKATSNPSNCYGPIRSKPFASPIPSHSIESGTSPYLSAVDGGSSPSPLQKQNRALMSRATTANRVFEETMDEVFRNFNVSLAEQQRIKQQCPLLAPILDEYNDLVNNRDQAQAKNKQTELFLQIMYNAKDFARAVMRALVWNERSHKFDTGKNAIFCYVLHKLMGAQISGQRGSNNYLFHHSFLSGKRGFKSRRTEFAKGVVRELEALGFYKDGDKLTQILKQCDKKNYAEIQRLVRNRYFEAMYEEFRGDFDAFPAVDDEKEPASPVASPPSDDNISWPLPIDDEESIKKSKRDPIFDLPEETDDRLPSPQPINQSTLENHVMSLVEHIVLLKDDAQLFADINAALQRATSRQIAYLEAMHQMELQIQRFRESRVQTVQTGQPSMFTPNVNLNTGVVDFESLL